MKSLQEWLESTDDQQNELILILHHVGDVEEMLKKIPGTKPALDGLADIRDSVKRLQHGLSPQQIQGIHKTED